jgi:tetratricopeptide (TPR) repeat protein
MKKFKFSRYSLLIMLVLPVFFLESLTGFFDLNKIALRTSRNLFSRESQNVQSISDQNNMSNNLSCHLKWLSFDPVINKNPFAKNDKSVTELMNCSMLHVYFIRIFAPTDMELAQEASLIYPEDPGILYWLADGIEKDDPDQAEQLFRRIVKLQPYNGRAWHRLGRLVEQRGLISEAISYYHNSCVNNDPGNHGCLNAGRLLEQEGRYDEAIYYYRLSRLASIRANADRLEELLAGSD